jgi:hypothetical protein
MERGLARAVPWVAFAIGYLAAWFISSALPVPLLWHLPLERRFTFEVHPLGLAADYYGRLLLCLSIGGLSWLAGRLLARRLRAEWFPGLCVWCLAILLFTAGLNLYVLAGRQPIAAPLPDGYVPR